MPPPRVDLASAEEECGDTAMGRVLRAYDQLAPGQRLEVLTDVAEQAFAVRTWARRSGIQMLDDSRVSGRFRLVVSRPAG
jgi:TusA-related sulfurtransferase